MGALLPQTWRRAAALMVAGALAPTALAAGVSIQVVPPEGSQVSINVHGPQRAVAALERGEADRVQELLGRLRGLSAPPPSYLSQPATAANSPTAFGSGWGAAYMGVGWEERGRYNESEDGSVGVGFGLGDARDTVALSVGLSLHGVRGEGAGDGSVALKASRSLGAGWHVAAGAEDLLHWGDGEGTESVYGAVTKVVALRQSTREPFSRLTISAGAGNERFRREKEVLADTGDLGAFASLGLRVNEWAGLFTEWTGQDMGVGLSLVPSPHHALVVTPAWTDILSKAGDGDRFTLGVTYAVFFR